MKNNLITKIALGVAAAAMLFSIVTLIRSITIGSGVLLAAILVVGTAVIVAICAVMLYVFNNYDFGGDDDEDNDDEDDEDEEEASSDDPHVKSKKKKESPAPAETADELEAEVDSLIADLESDRPYDLHNFE